MKKYEWTTWNGYEIKLTVSKNSNGLKLESFEIDGQVIPAEFEISNRQEINFEFEEQNSAIEIPKNLYTEMLA